MMRALSHRFMQRGFTLIELLVAVVIFAILAAAGYAALNNSMRFREVTDQSILKLHELQTAVRLLGQDFEELTPRPVRDPLGGPNQPALVADARNAYVVLLTRAGWTNNAGVQRPGLQRVGYLLDNGTLRRDSWTVLDATQSNEPVRREVLRSVKRFEIRYLGSGREWLSQWPAPGGQQAQSERAMPIAVEVTLEIDGWGTITRLFEVPG